MTLAKRKAYAAHCLENGRTNTRGFDNCFEEGDGALVVSYLMKRALSCGNADINSFYEIGREYTINSKEYKALQSKRSAIRLRDGIKDAGLWDSWLKTHKEA
jgi:hypothetical protein